MSQGESGEVFLVGRSFYFFFGTAWATPRGEESEEDQFFMRANYVQGLTRGPLSGCRATKLAGQRADVEFSR